MNITDWLRIKRHDDRNVIIEIYEETKNPRTGEVNHAWKREGFYPTPRHALRSILSKDMLIDVNQIETLTAYVAAFRNQIAQVTSEVRSYSRFVDIEYENEQLKKEIEKLKEEADQDE